MAGCVVSTRWILEIACVCRIRRSVLLLVLLALSGVLNIAHAAGGEFQGDVPETSCFGKKILSIEYSAESPVNRAHYDPYIGLQPGDVLTRTGLKGAIQSLYDSGRFSSITAESFAEDGGVRLRFVVEHNYYFNKFILEDDLDLKSRPLWEWVSLPVGKRFTYGRLLESRKAVLDFIKKRGYYLAQVEVRTEWDDTSRQVNVIFSVQPGNLAVIRSIEIQGVPEKDAKDLLKKFGYREGKEFDRSRLSDRMEDLREYFFNEGFLAVVAEVYEDFDPTANSVGLRLTVYNYGVIRVLVKGFKVERNRMYRLMSVLTREGDRETFLKIGVDVLKGYLEEQGYYESDVSVIESEENGTYTLRYDIEKGRKSIIEYVQFQGSTVFTDRELLESVGIRPPSFLHSTAFSESRLEEGVVALKSLYELRGYLNAEIEYSYRQLGKESRFIVTYTCIEGPVSLIRDIDFKGNANLQTDELLRKIRQRPGSAYSPTIAEQDRQALLAAYSDTGYLQAKVTVEAVADDDSNEYLVVYHLEEGTQFLVDGIFVLGIDHTRPSVVNKRIKLRTGDPLSLGKMLETQQALYRLGIFDQVRVVQQNPDSQNPYQNIVVRLREAQRFTIRYGIGYREDEKLRGTLEFSDLNILGLARRADIRLRGSSKEQQAVFNLRQTQYLPLPVDSYLSLSASYEQGIFDIRRLGASYQFSQPISDHSWGLFRYSFQNVRSLNLDLSDPEYDRENIPRNLSTFSIAYVNDSRDNYLDPEKGFFSSTDFGITTKLLGDNDYISFYTQNSYYRVLPKSFMTAISLRFGVLRPYHGSNVPISERFFAGGASSLRGFETDFAGPLVKRVNPVEGEELYIPVGGNALFIGSMELRRPIFSFLHIAGFYDVGNVFRDLEDMRFPGFSHTVGAGLRIKTPFGPLRFDYGYNMNLPLDLRAGGLKRGHLFITVGPPF